VIGEISGGRYALSEFLGAGGMAEVFLAHERILGRDLALKVLRQDYAKDADFVSRFQREAVSAAALNHPHVVQVYDRGRSEDGRLYIAMEHVPGATSRSSSRGADPSIPRRRRGSPRRSQKRRSRGNQADRGISISTLFSLESITPSRVRVRLSALRFISVCR
jgi:serine/threonine protein kinase